jgi:hypothetical protein
MTRREWLFPAVVALTLLGAVACARGDIVYRFDMNEFSGLTQAGFTAIAPGSQYAAVPGYGWEDPSGLDYRDRGAIPGDPLSDLMRDFHFGGVDRTFLVDLPNDTYDITCYFRDTASYHDDVQVLAEGTLMLADVDVRTDANVIETFRIAVADGRLNLTLHDNGGTNPHWVFNGFDIVVPEPAGLSLLAAGALPAFMRRIKAARSGARKSGMSHYTIGR